MGTEWRVEIDLRETGTIQILRFTTEAMAKLAVDSAYAARTALLRERSDVSGLQEILDPCPWKEPYLYGKKLEWWKHYDSGVMAMKDYFIAKEDVRPDGSRRGDTLTHRSDRGFPLVWSCEGHDPDAVVLTVENYCKWYHLFLVHPDGRVEQVPFPDEPEYCTTSGSSYAGSSYADHVPNPAVVQRFADAKRYEIDERAFEVMVGRWHLEAMHEDETLK